MAHLQIYDSRQPLLNHLLEGVLDNININMQPGLGGLSEDDIQKLRQFFPDNLLLAALDLIDRDRVTEHQTTWGRSFYEVYGSTSTYAITLNVVPDRPHFCTCPSYAFSVLLSEENIMCKHILAVMVARRLNRCVIHRVAEDGFSALAAKIYPL